MIEVLMKRKKHEQKKKERKKCAEKEMVSRAPERSWWRWGWMAMES